MCRFLSIICDMSSKRLRDLLRTHLLNAARSTPLGPSLLHYVVIGMAEIDPNLKDVLCLGKYFKAKRASIAYMESTVVDISIPPSLFQTCFIVFFTISSILKHPSKSFFNPIKYI